MNNLLRGLRIAAIFAMLAFVSGAPMSAQSNSTGAGTGTSTSSGTRTMDRDDDTDWGWIGLLGLLGLAGLIPKKRTDVHRDDNNKHGR